MIALDTNVLVRFLVRDDVAQHRKAVRLIERAANRGEPLLVSTIVLCELVWVLGYSYKVSRAAIASTLHQLLRSRQLQIQGRDEALGALERYSSGRGDFADYLILEGALAAGASTVATFDRALIKDEGFSSP